MASVREYAILYIRGTRTGGTVVGGGNAVLGTGQHALDGPEHTAASDTTALDASIDAHGLLPKLSGDPDDGLHGDGAWAPFAAGSETPVEHGAMGATETIDLADGVWHRGTLSANCAITVAGFTVDQGVVVLVKLMQNATGGWAITWDSDVVFAGDDQPDLTALGVSWFLLWSDEGDPTIYGARVGGTGVTYGTPAIVLGTVAADGAVDEAIRRDAAIVAFDATAPSTQAMGDAAATGAAAVAARRDHKHAMPAFGSPVAVGTANSDGIATSVPRSDHVHQGADASGQHTHIVGETHLSDGAATAYTLDQAFEPGSVEALNTTTLAYLTVTETLPDQVAVSAAGAAGDKLTFSYAGSLA